jgi:G3E family GTPase
MEKDIDLYLISGFLGAGKTTFLQHILTGFQNKRTGLIINEFGSIGIDGKLLDRDGIKMVEINNGSIFCSCLKGGFVRTLIAFTKEDIDVLFIENSGMADPSNMHRLLTELEGKTQRQYHYKGAVCVLDAVSFLKHVQVLTPVENQVVSSNFILINKTDQVNQDTIQKIRDKISQLNPDAYIYQTVFAEVPEEILQEKLSDNGFDRDTSNQPYNRMTACALECRELTEEKNLKKFIRAMKGKTYRIKGFVLTEQGWIQVDGVGEDCNLKSTELHKWDIIEHTRLVMIGNGSGDLEKEALEKWNSLCRTKGEIYE